VRCARALTRSPMVMVPAWMPWAHITMVAVSATLKMALCPKLSRDRLLWVLRARGLVLCAPGTQHTRLLSSTRPSPCTEAEINGCVLWHS